jgi:hypothetical protein
VSWPPQLDVSPLDKVKRHNHDFPILTIDNPKGQVLAKSKATLKVHIAMPLLFQSHSFGQAKASATASRLALSISHMQCQAEG